MPQEFELVFMTGPRAGETLPLQDGQITLGRSRQSTVVLEDPLVSREHFQLEVTAEAVMLRDLNSSHGTFLNEKRLRGAVSLAHDDVIQAGNTRLRFCAKSEEPPESATVAAAAGPSSDEMGSRTRAVDGSAAGGETAYAPAPEAGKAQPAEDYEQTRVVAQGETRMLEAPEQRGLKAVRPRAPLARSPVAGLVVIGLAALVAALLVARHRGSRDAVSDSSAMNRYDDTQFGFSIACPDGWSRSAEPQLLSFELRGNGRTVLARVDFYADRDARHTLTGLTMGFENYLRTLESRHKDFQLKGSMPMDVNEARVIFYAFRGAQVVGKALYTLSGDTRIVVECVCAPDYWEPLKDTFSQILTSFALRDRQRYIDYPKPDDEMRKLALGSPDQLLAQARAELEHGQDLLKRRDVRPENLYNAVQTLQRCLQMSSAFLNETPIQQDALRRLAEAKTAFEQTVRDHDFAIQMALKQGETQRAYWEAYRLMQMVPDKTDPIYQYAYGLTKQYSGEGQGTE